MVYQYSTYQYICVGTEEQDVKLWNNYWVPILLWQGIYDLLSNDLDIWGKLRENFDCSYYWTIRYLFYYYRVQYNHKTEQNSGYFREDGVMTSASLNKSEVILFQNYLISNKQAKNIFPLSSWGYLNNYEVHLCVYFETKVKGTVYCHGYRRPLQTVSAVIHLISKLRYFTLVNSLMAPPAIGGQNSPTLDVTHLCCGATTSTILKSVKC